MVLKAMLKLIEMVMPQWFMMITFVPFSFHLPN